MGSWASRTGEFYLKFVSGHYPRPKSHSSLLFPKTRLCVFGTSDVGVANLDSASLIRRLRRPTEGKEIHTIPIPEHPLNMAWSPDGQWIVVANKFNVFTIISAAQGSVHNSHKELDEVRQVYFFPFGDCCRREVQANEMIFSQTADHLAVASGVGLKLFSAPSMDLLSTIDAHPASCASLDLDPRGRCGPRPCY